ncbi:hypothetical protein SAMN06272781_0134 [Streptomyces sp. 1222.2]|nr:hypothetical protein SAMN06272781_0134 [Streptomyces sp. 1222.2]
MKPTVIEAGKQTARPVQWREGSRPGSGRSGVKRMYSRFVVLRVRPAGREIRKACGGPELPVCWLLAEWPAGQPEPVQFWLSNLPADTPLATLVRTVKLRWRIAHDYREMKQVPGPGSLRRPHLARLAPPRHPRLRRTRLLHPPAHHPVPKRDGAGLSLYKVARELQLLLAVWTGPCPTCHRNMPEPVPT